MEFLVFEEILDALAAGENEFCISESYFDYTVELLEKRGLKAEFTPVFSGFKVKILKEG